VNWWQFTGTTLHAGTTAGTGGLSLDDASFQQS
jgi:hypothetical protein